MLFEPPVYRQFQKDDINLMRKRKTFFSMFQILSQINTFQFSNSTFQNNIRSIHMKQCFLGYAFPSNTRKTKTYKKYFTLPRAH